MYAFLGFLKVDLLLSLDQGAHLVGRRSHGISISQFLVIYCCVADVRRVVSKFPSGILWLRLLLVGSSC